MPTKMFKSDAKLCCQSAISSTLSSSSRLSVCYPFSECRGRGSLVSEGFICKVLSETELERAIFRLDGKPLFIMKGGLNLSSTIQNSSTGGGRPASWSFRESLSYHFIVTTRNVLCPPFFAPFWKKKVHIFLWRISAGAGAGSAFRQ